jgi:SAM-dependent MidA family methyltransferase
MPKHSAIVAKFLLQGQFFASMLVATWWGEYIALQCPDSWDQADCQHLLSLTHLPTVYT